MKIKFTHLWVDEFGWEVTILTTDEFAKVEKFGRDNEGNIIFTAIQDNDRHQILKGYYQSSL